jgi:hypothetical protein
VNNLVFASAAVTSEPDPIIKASVSAGYDDDGNIAYIAKYVPSTNPNRRPLE